MCFTSKKNNKYFYAPNTDNKNICLDIITPENTVFAFDFHGVIARRSISLILKYMFKYMFKNLKNFLKLLRFLLNPIFWIYVFKITRKTGVTDDIFEQLVQKYAHLKTFKKYFIELDTQVIINQKTVSILEQLKARNFQICFLSNMGQWSRDELARRNPKLFNLFDFTYLPQAADNYLQKPSSLFYQKFLKTLHAHIQDSRNKQILFVDDKIRNIYGAVQENIPSFLFKSADDLKKFLDPRLQKPLS